MPAIETFCFAPVYGIVAVVGYYEPSGFHPLNLGVDFLELQAHNRLNKSGLQVLEYNFQCVVGLFLFANRFDKFLLCHGVFLLCGSGCFAL